MDNQKKYQQRSRCAFTSHQVAYLEEEYKKHPYIKAHQRWHIANELGMSEKSVKIWFQNRRMKERSASISLINDDEQNEEMTSQSAFKLSNSIMNSPVNDQLSSTVSLPLINTFDENDCKEIFMIGIKLWSENERMKERKENSTDNEESDEMTLHGAINRPNNITNSSLNDPQLASSSSSQNIFDKMSESRNIIEKAMLQSGINELINDMDSSVNDQQPVSLSSLKTIDKVSDIFYKAKKIWLENRMMKEKKECGNDNEQTVEKTLQSAIDRSNNVTNPSAHNLPLINTFDESDCKEIFMIGIKIWFENEGTKERKEYGIDDEQSDEMTLQGASTNRSSNIMSASLINSQLASSSSQNTFKETSDSRNFIEEAILQSGINQLSHDMDPLAHDQTSVSSPSFDEICDLFEKAKKIWLVNLTIKEKRGCGIDDQQNIEMTLQSSINRSNNVRNALPLINTFDESDCKEIFMIGIKLWCENERIEQRKECGIDDEQNDEIPLQCAINRSSNVITSSLTEPQLASSSSHNTFDETSESININENITLSVNDQRSVSLSKHQKTFDEKICDIFERAKKIWLERKMKKEKEGCRSVDERRNIMTRQSTINRLHNDINPSAKDQQPVSSTLLNTYRNLSKSTNLYLPQVASAHSYKNSRGDNRLKRTCARKETNKYSPTFTSDYLTKRRYIPTVIEQGIINNQIMDETMPQDLSIPKTCGVLTNPAQIFNDSRNNPVLPTVPPFCQQSYHSTEGRSWKPAQRDTTVTFSRKSLSVHNVSNMPSKPSVSNVPSAPNVPNIPSIPYLPSIPNARGLPGIPSVFNVTNVSKVPSVPGEPNMPNVSNFMYIRYARPNVPSVPNIPNMHSIPNVPNMRSPCNVPSKSNAHSVRKTPSKSNAPGVANMPSKSNAPHIPSVRNVPSKSNAPGVPDAPSKSNAPRVPDVPSKSNAPRVSSEPSVPSVPNVPTEPKVPSVSNVSTIPRVPSVHNVPTVSKVLSVPNLPTVPGVASESNVTDVPNVPDEPNKQSITNVPSVPNIPMTPNIPNVSTVPSEPTKPNVSN